MNDRISERVKCPFYVNVVRGKNSIGVKCETLSGNLGFDVTHYIKLQTVGDLTDYMEIFCCDMWETCPYARAIKAIKYNEKG